jgi:hypothetical protein
MNRILICCLIFGLIWQILDITVAEATAVAVSTYAILRFIQCLGEQIALLECIGFIAALEILLVPAVTYLLVPASMPIESAVYFGYALPAFLTFYVGINRFRHQPSERKHWEFIQAAAAYLQNKRRACLTLMVIGIIGFGVKIFVPTAPTFVGNLPSYSLFISVLYAYYSGSRYRVLIIGIASAALLIYTILSGMFGDLFFWLMLLIMFIAADRPAGIPAFVKAGFSLLAVGFLLLIQSIKGEYRYNTWGYRQAERRADAGLMLDLVTDRLTHPEKLMNTQHFLLSSVRFNQGIMLGSAMAKVPMHESYANGEVFLSLLYPFVPRFIWPGKPQAGGYENIRRFTSLPQLENTSVNLSPLGEGYVNFGYGGILFGLLYGLLLSTCFWAVFRLAEQMPSVILWLPMLFIGCLTMETDLFSTWGSLLNNALFITSLFWLLKRIGIQL